MSSLQSNTLLGFGWHSEVCYISDYLNLLNLLKFEYCGFHFFRMPNIASVVYK